MENQAESRVMAQVTRELRDRFPDIEPRVIDTTVAEVLEGFAESSVRDFLPILVQREAQVRLRARPMSHAS